jgi:ribonuclease P protein component
MKFSTSLKKNYEFKRLYNRGKSAASKYVVVYCNKNRKDYNQLGITVTTKIGGAVTRNRVRRRLKEIYRLNESNLQFGYDIVIVARMRSVDSSWQELESSVLYLFKKLGIWTQGAM